MAVIRIKVQATYETDAVTPDLDLYVPTAALTYAEVGGAMIGGGMGAAAPGLVSLVNSSEIPAQYQSVSAHQPVIGFTMAVSTTPPAP